MRLGLPAFNRSHIALVHDVVMAAISFPLAMYLRLGPDMWPMGQAFLAEGTFIFTVVCAVVFWTMRLYAGVWRYASINDLRQISLAITVAILVFVPALFLISRLASVPRSIPIITWLVLVVLLGGPRFLYRIYKDRRIGTAAAQQAPRRIPVLLIGAGDAADLFIRAINHSPMASYRVVGLLDEKGTRVGRNIHGVHVLGDLADLEMVMARLTREGQRPQRLILTKDNVEGSVIRRLLAAADKQGAPLSRVPKLTDFQNGVSETIPIRPIAIEDLLGRPQTVLDRASMQALICGRRVLVTGAGGTIGSELSRQIASYGPAALALLDASEFLLYAIDLEIAERYPALMRKAILADVRERARVERVIAEEAPELVFHAAALKHVPIVELYPHEGVLTNVIGSRNVADACRANGVAAMVLVSTDKAVNPSSVMGATKRIAESYCQALDILETQRMAGGKPRTRYITVRFGNVLGSTGSVVPLFQRQLAAGGPLTVTHPEMKRYFMTVREAVELVLEASALGMRERKDEGKIYVLDMGEPVRILDLARQMILLAGLRPETDIKIAFTGMRPGEKLNEEILHGAEALVPTAYNGILLAAPRTADHALIARAIDELAAIARGGGSDLTVQIARMVPEFVPAAASETRVSDAG